MNGQELIRMTDDEWRGYITGVLEGIKTDITEVKQDGKSCNEKIGKLDRRTGTISGTVALAVSILGTLIVTFFKHLMGGS